MRAILGLLLVVLLAPPVAAQVPPSLVVGVDALAPAAPLKDHVQAPFRVDVSCLLAPPGQQITVHAWVAQAPAWAQVVALPATFQVDPAGCNGARTTVQGTLVATATDQAPAWTPGQIVLGASVDAVQGNQTATAGTNFTATYFGVLDASTREAVVTVAPGETHTFTVALGNHGNGRTRVSLRLANATDWLRVDPIPDVVLDSVQQGGTAVSQDVPVKVSTQGGGVLSNRVGTFTLSVTSEEARDPPTPGDSATISFVVTERGRATPGAPPVAILLGVVLVALLRRAGR